jgi:hypothetical protein
MHTHRAQVEFDTETLHGFELVTSKWSRIFFGVYYICGVLLAVNIVVAFVRGKRREEKRARARSVLCLVVCV